MKVATILLVCAFVHGQSIELNQNGCPKDYSKEKLYAHEDCNKYYQCTHGNLVERICFMGLLFNVDEQKCDWPHDVDCGNRIIPGENDNGNEDGNGSGNGNGNGSGNGNNGNESGNNGNGGGSVNGNGENNGSCNCECSCPGPNENGNENGNENDNGSDGGDSGSGGGDCDNGNGNGDNGNGNGDNGNGNGDNGDGDNGNGGNDGSCNCNPGEAPSICKRPGSDNVLIAHEDCNKFYKCAHGIPVPQDCPGILLYNPPIGVCDWPQNVDCGDRIIPDSNENGNGNGDGGNGDGSGDNGNGNGDDGNGNGDNGDGDNGNGGNDGSCNCNPGEAPSICKRPGSDNVLIAHEDCNKFYKCAHGIPVPQDCPGILLYNPHIGVCDWPQNVDCGDRIIPDPNENGDGSGDGGNGDGNGDNGNGNGDNGNGNGDNGNGNGDNGNGNGDNGNGNGDNGDGDNGNGGNDGTCNCNPGEAPSICRRPGSDNVLVAHEDCNKFYKCAHGIPEPQDCPGILLYNPHIGVCDWPQNVDCGDRIIPDPNENGDEGNGDGNGDSGNGNGDNGNGNGDNGNGNGDNGNGNGDNGDGGNDGSCNCNPGEAPSICSRPGSGNVLVAHEDCNKFYKCAHGIPVPQDCPGVLLYNPHIRACDWPQNVDCGDRITPDSNENGNGNGDGNGDNGDGNGDNDNGNVDGGDGGGNNSNENGNSNEDISCEDSSNEENNNGNNNGSCNCNPQEAVPICQQHGSDGIHVAHEHCTKYYRCISGIAVPMSCPKGLYYNPYEEGCDWPNNVDCADRIIPDPDDIDSVEDIDSDENKDIIICNCDPKEAPLICARNNSDNVLVASENCNQYYICDNGKPTIRDCPDNLLYNPYKEVCDWPQDIDCGDRVIPDPKEIDNGNEGGNENSSESEINRPCNCDPDQAEAICAAENSESTMIAHQICNKYYICNFGLPVVQKCQGNLLYNPHKEVCDWSANVDCGNRLKPQPNDTDTGSCNCSPKEAPLICAHENSSGVVIAHENCHQYYKCLNRRPMVLSCFSSYLFDPFKQKCDKPENVNCGHRFRINDNN